MKKEKKIFGIKKKKVFVPLNTLFTNILFKSYILLELYFKYDRIPNQAFLDKTH